MKYKIELVHEGRALVTNPNDVADGAFYLTGSSTRCLEDVNVWKADRFLAAFFPALRDREWLFLKDALAALEVEWEWK